MPTNGSVILLERRGADPEVLRLIARIQELTLELQALRQHDPGGHERELERAVDRLRWRLAAAARRAATAELGSAA